MTSSFFKPHVLVWSVLSVLFMAVASTAQESGKVSIEIGNLGSLDSSDSWLQQEIAAFEAAHPGIAVVQKGFTEPNHERFPYVDKPPMARNVIGIDSRMGYETAYLVERGDLVPIESFLPDPDFSKDIFYDSYWDAVTYDDKTWGVPWQVWGDVLVLDWPLFEEAGFSAPPATWEELLDMAKKLTIPAGQNGGVAQWGLRVSTRDDTLQTMGLSIIMQRGGDILDNATFDLSHASVKEMLNYCNELGFQHGVTNIDRRSLREVLQDTKVRYAMHLEYNARLGPILNNKRLRLAPYPTSGEDITFCPKRLYFAIRKSTPEEERASWELIKWFSRKDVSLPAMLDAFPCRKDIVDREDFRDIADRSLMNLDVMYTSTARGRDLGAFGIHRIFAIDDLWDQLVPVIQGARTFEEAAPLAEAAGNARILPIESSPDDAQVLYE